MTYAHYALGDAIRTALLPLSVAVAETSETPWASATFSGARHAFRFYTQSDLVAHRLDRFTRSLTCREFDLPGHIVADIILADHHPSTRGYCMTIEALTVEAQ
jgi:hypothetical protein